MRKRFELPEAQFVELLEASKSTPAMYLPVGIPMFDSQRENAMRVRDRLGKEMGFEPFSVEPASGEPQRVFTAVVVEPASHDLAPPDREWQHGSCLAIAEGAPGWDTDFGDRASPAMLAVQTLRREVEKLRRSARHVTTSVCTCGGDCDETCPLHGEAAQASDGGPETHGGDR